MLTHNKLTSTNSTHLIKPPIALERPVCCEYSKDQYVNFKLKSNPTAMHSTNYKLNIPEFNGGEPKEFYLHLLSKLEKVLAGQTLPTKPVNMC
jgi:hypothetical protein